MDFVEFLQFSLKVYFFVGIITFVLSLCFLSGREERIKKRKEEANKREEANKKEKKQNKKLVKKSNKEQQATKSENKSPKNGAPAASVWEMIDQMELLPGEVPAEPGALKNQGRNKRKKLRKHFSKEDSKDFKSFEEDFIGFYFPIGFISLMITLFYNIIFSEDPYLAHLSLSCQVNSGLKNLYERNFLFDLHAFVSENETNFAQESELIWRKTELSYGDLQSVFSFSTNLPISERTQNKGSLYLKVCLTQSGLLPAPRKGDSWAELYTYCKTKRLNFFEEPNGENLSVWFSKASQVRSYWRSNWTVNLVGEGSLGFVGKEDGRVDCDPLTSKSYPLLYLNDNFNLARHCIPIDHTTESLPLNLTLKQISMRKLKDYLRQSDFKEYFRRSNLLNEEFIRRNLIASDFKNTGLFHIDYFWGILLVVLVKSVSSLLLEPQSWVGTDSAGNVVRKWSNRDNANIALGSLIFRVLLFPLCLGAICRAVEDSRGENDRESSIEAPVKHRIPSNEIEASYDYLKNFLRLKSRVILQTFVTLVLVPLLGLCLWFSLYRSSVVFSPRENLAMFSLLVLSNCFLYLASIFWNSGLLLFFDWPVPTETPSREAINLASYPIAGNFNVQLAVLWLVLHFFPLTGFSTPAFLVFIIFHWLLSDFASSICLIKLGRSIRKLKRMPATRSKLD